VLKKHIGQQQFFVPNCPRVLGEQDGPSNQKTKKNGLKTTCFILDKVMA
jgi:hypothetical protein